jgi:D-amino-acid oxidase
MVTDISNITKTVTRQNKDGSWNFIIPRGYNGGTIVGGTKEPSDWHTEPRAESREALLRGGKVLIPHGRDSTRTSAAEGHSDDDVRVVADIVGRRPTREGGMRIEVEEVDLQQDGGFKGRVIHAYGAGGRGYEMSCGIAEEVVELAMGLWTASRSQPSSKL